MLNQIVQGQRLISAGGSTDMRSDRTGAQVVTDGHARYMEEVLNGNVFIACNSAVQALSVNSTTATGLVLSNPLGSGKNLILLEVNVAIASLPAGQASLILTGNVTTTATVTTHTTPLTVRNALLGGPGNAPVGLADSAATIAAANILRVLGGGPAATVAASTAFPPFIRDEVAGLIVLSPGTCISLQSLTTAMSVVASMMWAELPV